jgi:hypothetical protein
VYILILSTAHRKERIDCDNTGLTGMRGYGKFKVIGDFSMMNMDIYFGGVLAIAGICFLAMLYAFVWALVDTCRRKRFGVAVAAAVVIMLGLCFPLLVGKVVL